MKSVIDLHVVYKRQNPHYEGDLRADLMAEAIEVIATSGPNAVSMRALTRSLGVSHAAPKNHFATKEALFAEIAREGFVLFEATLNKSAATAERRGADARHVLKALGLAYLNFAKKHASYFALMFRADLFDMSTIAAESAAAFNVLLNAVTNAQADGWYQDADSRTVATLLWSTVHGHAQLEAQSMPIGSSDAERVAVLGLLFQPSA